MTEANGTPHHAAAPDGSTSQLAGNLAEQVSRLIRDELKLAEYELTRKAKRFGRGAGMFGGSGLVTLYGVGACWPLRSSGSRWYSRPGWPP